MRKKRIIVSATTAVVAILFAGTYLGIGMHYTTHFFEHTTINGIDVSDMTAEEAEAVIAAQVENYRIVLNEKDGKSETISGEQIGYHYVSGGEIQEFLDSQNILLWLWRYFGKTENRTVTTATAYDAELLQQAMLQLDCFDEAQVTEPKDAELSRQEDGTYQIVPETEGNLLKSDQVLELLTAAADGGENSIDLVESGSYEKPSVYSDNTDLKEKAEVLNRYAAMNVTYYMGGDIVQTLDSSTISSWMTLDEQNQPVFDREAVRSYVTQMAADYDTIGTWEPFYTSLGETVYVEARTYGWQIDQEQETEDLYQLLLAGQSAERSPAYYETAVTRGENDIGSTYVEIDYTNQRMWYYQDGVLIVDTPVVTGCVAKGTESPEGIFCLVGKSENEILKGEGYATPVEYWMPFFGGVGIHDADSWRGGAYGGTIYQYSGSHGCINTPTANAATLYSCIDVGTPIVCYRATIDQGIPATGDAGGIGTDDSADITIGQDTSGITTWTEDSATAETDSQGETGAADSESFDEEAWADESVYWG